MKVYTEDRLVSAPITERQDIEGGFKTVTLGHKQGFVRITIDVEAMARLVAQKAIRGKSGRATALSGLVKGQLLKGTITEHREPLRARYD